MCVVATRCIASNRGKVEDDLHARDATHRVSTKQQEY